jgi:hypothetical protein
VTDSFEATARQDIPPWYEEEGWLREPIFEDVPFEQSGWQPLIGVLERVNQLKAHLLISVYEEQVRIAYRQYRRIRQDEEARFAAERAEAEQRNDALRSQIRAVEQAMEQVRMRWQPELDALRQQLYSAWQDAYVRAAQAGINLRGDPLMEDASPPNSVEQPAEDSQPSTASPTPPNLTPARDLPALSTPPLLQPPALTPTEVMHEHNLPTYQERLIPRPLWIAMVVMAGIGLGWIMGLITGFLAPQQPEREPLWLGVTMLAGVALTYLWVRTLQGAAAIVAELYHLFGWHERKARRVAWVIGVGLVIWLVITAALWFLLASLGRTAGNIDTSTATVLILTSVLLLSLLACALLEGFLEGRANPIGHWIATCIKRDERLRFQSVNNTGATSLNADTHDSDGQQQSNALMGAVGAHPSAAEQEAWTAIRYYQALLRQYHHLKGEMEQELAPYRMQIEQLQAEMRPIYSAMPPHSRNRIRLAYLEWLRMYQLFLQYLADALRECQGGEELAEIVRQTMLQIPAEARR